MKILPCFVMMLCGLLLYQYIAEMSLSWIKTAVYGDARPPEKPESVVIAESLLMELDAQIKEAEERQREKELEERRKTQAVDYSWLITTVPKSYEMQPVERLELEDLCSKVSPHESGQVITMFRGLLVREPPIPEIPRILRSVIMQTMQRRPKEETMTDWVTRRTKSIAQLRPSSKVMPLLASEDASSLDRRTSLPAYCTHNQVPEELNVQNLQRACRPVRLEDLPV